MSKDMAVKASIDVGENITQLVEGLARQIGTTADMVFPWYVRQQVIEGYVFFTIISIIGLIALSVFLRSMRKADFSTGDWNTHNYVLGTSGGVLVIWFIVLSGESANSLSKIINPNYHALQAMIADMAKLVH